MEFMETALEMVVEGGILAFEWVGVIVLILAGIQGVISYFRRDPAIRLNLAKGLALSLEFKLGGEILHTVLARSLSDIAVVGAIIVLRAALTFLIHWEIKNEEEALPAAEHKEK